MNNWSSKYRYTEAYVKQHAPLTGGVYRLIYQKGTDYYVFYVGQSDNLQRRLMDHLGASEKDFCIKRHLRDYSCFFRYIEIPSLDERLRIEREQIQEYNPECNG